ncbi:MAG: glycosyltransferase [Candidatus Altiarchaeales archaeon]|nr:glycosyltransferase [Candidatus Altiarchaeales archaeon]MBD3415549.1 glycosyltransferase [Candidatus Altiarchaeales archaeon]
MSTDNRSLGWFFIFYCHCFLRWCVLALDLLVCVTSTDNRELLRDCLASIMAYPPSCPHEVWVIDNASADGTSEMLASEFPTVKVSRNETRLGVGANRKKAVSLGRAGYYAIMSEDIRLMEGTLDNLLSAIASDPRIGFITGRYLHPDGSLQNPCYANYPSLLTEACRSLVFPRFITHLLGLRAAPWDLWPTRKFYDGPGQLACANGCFYMARAEVFDDVGSFDEWFFMYYEEVEMMLRAYKHGWKVWYTPSASVLHSEHGSTTSMSRRRTLHHMHSLYHLFNKHYGAPRTRQLWWAKTIIGALFSPLMLLSHLPGLPGRVRAKLSMNKEILYWHLKHWKMRDEIVAGVDTHPPASSCPVCRKIISGK